MQVPLIKGDLGGSNPIQVPLIKGDLGGSNLRYSQDSKDDLFAHEDLCKALDQLYHYPLRQSALDRLNRGLRTGISDRQLADLLVSLYKDDRLCIVHPQESTQEPQIICSLGLFQPS